jgi:hypothetical protein
MRMTDLKAGWAIVGNDGRRLATVEEVGQHYVVATRGGITDQLYVPASAIANVEHDVVHLNITKREAEQMGWEQPPRDEDSPESAQDTDLLHRHI